MNKICPLMSHVRHPFDDPHGPRLEGREYNYCIESECRLFNADYRQCIFERMEEHLSLMEKMMRRL